VEKENYARHPPPDSSENQRIPISVSSAVLIENKNGDLLLIRESGEREEKWGPVAGGMKQGEGPKETAIREAFEEIGVKIELTSLVGVYPVDREGSPTGIGFVFYTKIVKGVIDDSEDSMEYCYYSAKEIDKLLEQGLIYRPEEYNLHAINAWKNGKSYPLEVINTIYYSNTT